MLLLSYSWLLFLGGLSVVVVWIVIVFGFGSGGFILVGLSGIVVVVGLGSLFYLFDHPVSFVVIN